MVSRCVTDFAVWFIAHGREAACCFGLCLGFPSPRGQRAFEFVLKTSEVRSKKEEKRRGRERERTQVTQNGTRLSKSDSGTMRQQQSKEMRWIHFDIHDFGA